MTGIDFKHFEALLEVLDYISKKIKQSRYNIPVKSLIFGWILRNDWSDSTTEKIAFRRKKNTTNFPYTRPLLRFDLQNNENL